MAGSVLRALWRRASRAGRLHRELRVLEAGGLLGRNGSGPLDERVFRLTAAGRQVLGGATDPERRWARAWDGKWRLVLFDVPQVQSALRERLRRKLRRLQFGWLQNSVWLSPDPLHELLQQFQTERISVESLALLEARPVGGETDAEFVAGAWDFARVERVHAAYLKVVRLQPSRARRASAPEWVAWARVEQRAWREVCRHDPFLPEPLLPAGYGGRGVCSARREALHACGQALARAGGFE